ncbi:MAG: hypothetical protein Kow0031_14370 [Anaerolineae bacterium]
MTDIDRIKRAARITDLVAQRYTLDDARPGRRLRTTKEHDSLVINTDTNRYTWYSKSGSNGRAESGDVIDWVGRYRLNYGDAWRSDNPAMFKEAVGELARFTGLPEPEFKPETAEARARWLTTEALFDLADEHYRRRFSESAEAQQYAAGRGFSPETIHRAHLGYSGGAPASLPGDRPRFGSDLTHAIPAADRPLAADIGLISQGSGGYYDAIPQGYLIYPHWQHGKIVYFAGRAIWTDDKKLKARNMAGPKRMYWATWAGIGGPLVIVEGQADALSWAQWGYSALALCGVNSADLDREMIELFSSVYLWADADGPGQASIDQLAEVVGPLLRLPSSPLYHLDKTPFKDSNDLLRAGVPAETLTLQHDQAGSYLERYIQRLAMLPPAQRDEHLPRLFGLLARLDKFQMMRYRAGIIKKLGISRTDFNAMLKIAHGDQAKAVGFKRGEQYGVLEGWTVVYDIDKNGQPAPTGLVDAEFRIDELIIYDNGSGEMRHEYAISGKRANGRSLPGCTVPTSEYESMKWIYENYPHVILSAGRATRDHLRAAVQHLSGDIPHRTVYEHTGWKNINSQMVYLTSSGALGLPADAQAITVDLKMGRPETNMSGYHLPLIPENVPDAIRASLRLWDLVEWEEVPLMYWASAYLPPLSPFIQPDFGIWPHGKTGSFKSVFAALAQAHYGEYWAGRDGRLLLPSNFISTVNNIAMDAFIAKDVLLVVDDYAPGNTERERRERDEVASRLLRSLGNKAARGRMKDGRRYQASYPPRCLAMVTAEDVPPGHSILARGIGVRVPTLPLKGTLERETIEQAVSQAQDVDAWLYPHAMAAYVLWIQRHWDDLRVSLPKAVVRNNKLFTNVGHARLPDAFAKLQTAIDTALFFAQDAGAISQTEAGERQDRARAALQKVMVEHSGQIEALDPVLIFCETLREQLDAREWYLDSTQPPATDAEPEWKHRAWCAGWQDDTFIYLLPKAVTMLMKSYSQQGIPFPISRNSLYNRLREANIVADIKTHYIPALDTSPWVLIITRRAIYGEG